MLKLKKYQQYILGLLSSFILLLLGAAILAFSLFQANRKQADSLAPITPDIFNLYSQQ